MTVGKKEGIATKDEFKILWDLVDDKLGIPGILKPIAKLAVPGILDGIDNKVAERIPEKWQIHCENIITMTVKAVEDKVITKQEANEIAEYCAVVIDATIDVPLLNDDVEAVMFLELFRLLSTGLYSLAKEKLR